jgi:hypothetical protein
MYAREMNMGENRNCAHPSDHAIFREEEEIEEYSDGPKYVKHLAKKRDEQIFSSEKALTPKTNHIFLVISLSSVCITHRSDRVHGYM